MCEGLEEGITYCILYEARSWNRPLYLGRRCVMLTLGNAIIAILSNNGRCLFCAVGEQIRFVRCTACTLVNACTSVRMPLCHSSVLSTPLTSLSIHPPSFPPCPIAQQSRVNDLDFLFSFVQCLPRFVARV